MMASCFRCGFVAAMLCGDLTLSSAQSFNIDYGTGTSLNPSPTFGAAAGQPGYWNGVDNKQVTIYDVTRTSKAYFVGFGGTGGGFYNNKANTGDYARLLNGGDEFSRAATFRIFGLRNGLYRVYTYAAAFRLGPRETYITVSGSPDPGQTVTGLMPGNQFVYLVTHAIHDIYVSNGEIVISGKANFLNPGGSQGNVNGFQIVALPDPLSAMLMRH